MGSNSPRLQERVLRASSTIKMRITCGKEKIKRNGLSGILFLGKLLLTVYDTIIPLFLLQSEKSIKVKILSRMIQIQTTLPCRARLDIMASVLDVPLAEQPNSSQSRLDPSQPDTGIGKKEIRSGRD